MPQDEQNRREERGWAAKYAEYSQIAVALPAATFVGYLIGYLLDKWLHTTFLYLVFLLIGIAAGLIQVIRFANRERD